jgi:hypothetical protein
VILGQPVKIKPVNGKHLRKENGQILSAEGETVIATAYWLRRLNDGDVVEVAPEESKPKPKPKG